MIRSRMRREVGRCKYIKMASVEWLKTIMKGFFATKLDSLGVNLLP